MRIAFSDFRVVISFTCDRFRLCPVPWCRSALARFRAVYGVRGKRAFSLCSRAVDHLGNLGVVQPVVVNEFQYRALFR